MTKKVPEPQDSDKPSDDELARRVEDFVDERREVSAMEHILASDHRPGANEPAMRPIMAKYWLVKVRAVTLAAVAWIRSGGHRRG